MATKVSHKQRLLDELHRRARDVSMTGAARDRYAMLARELDRRGSGPLPHYYRVVIADELGMPE